MGTVFNAAVIFIFFTTPYEGKCMFTLIIIHQQRSVLMQWIISIILQVSICECSLICSYFVSEVSDGPFTACFIHARF